MGNQEKQNSETFKKETIVFFKIISVILIILGICFLATDVVPNTYKTLKHKYKTYKYEAKIESLKNSDTLTFKQAKVLWRTYEGFVFDLDKSAFVSYAKLKKENPNNFEVLEEVPKYTMSKNVYRLSKNFSIICSKKASLKAPDLEKINLKVQSAFKYQHNEIGIIDITNKVPRFSEKPAFLYWKKNTTTFSEIFLVKDVTYSQASKKFRVYSHSPISSTIFHEEYDIIDKNNNVVEQRYITGNELITDMKISKDNKSLLITYITDIGKKEITYSVPFGYLDYL